MSLIQGTIVVIKLKRTSSPQRAEDLYQELFLRIHRARDQFDSSRAFTPWFFQIAHRLLIGNRSLNDILAPPSDLSSTARATAAPAPRTSSSTAVA